MAQVKLTIDIDNAAFDDDTEGEVIRILQVAIERINRNGLKESDLRDVNGNLVGKLDVVA